MSKPNKTIHIRYFALLREERGLSDETMSTSSATISEFYDELKKKNKFSIPQEKLRVVINDAFKPWNTPLQNNDTVVFIPPISGG